jgi:hypothetical protein
VFVQYARAKGSQNLRPGIAEEEVLGHCASILDRKGRLGKEDNECIEIANTLHTMVIPILQTVFASQRREIRRVLSLATKYDPPASPLSKDVDGSFVGNRLGGKMVQRSKEKGGRYKRNKNLTWDSNLRSA